ncbi:hypothetical protein FA13DRAFT_1708233 [Coprinellus micaceus]|uniref:Uncharacterized protein n=1 Tax=Coprinellus micaceus TaxID=71717 RepID=A0A4Y7TGW1_COPMI|nr:hypothetical protein FA13DRAFT_1708233 [Coprinellus micaceus]
MSDPLAGDKTGRPQLLPEYAPPGLGPVDFWMERSNLAGIMIACVAYGILFTLFVQCVYLLRNSVVARTKQAKMLSVYSFVLWVLATLGIAGNIKFIQMTYIDYRNYPGGPNAFTFDFYTLPINMLGLVVYVLMNWAADGLLLYRFMVIYNFKWALLIFPGHHVPGHSRHRQITHHDLRHLTGLSVAMVVFTMNPAIGFWAPITINIGIAYWSTSIALNVILTVSIVGRLMFMRRKIRRLLGPKHDSPYTSVIAMLVESASLYTAWALVFMVCYAKGDIFQNVVLPSLGHIQVIAPLLIIFRFAQGKAWTSNTSTGMLSGNPSSTLPSFEARKGPLSASNISRTGANSFPLTTLTDSTAHLETDQEKTIYSHNSSGKAY